MAASVSPGPAAATSLPTKRDPVYGCELFQGQVADNGYGWLWVGHGKRAWAHRLAWEQANGPIPEGMEVGHGCKRRTCLALAHLELQTRRENVRAIHWKHQARRTHCPKGHDLFIFGLRTPEAGKVCRRCSFGLEGSGR